jgi:hypothetical protein
MTKRKATTSENHTISIVSYFSSFDEWLRNTMPQLNTQILERKMEPSVLKERVQSFVDEYPGIVHLDREGKRKALQYLGFAISSLERHVQDRGGAAGQALASLTNAESILIDLGNHLGHPPRDSLYTFGLWNRGPNSITFSGDSQEALFIDVINISIDHIENAGDLVRPIAKGLISLDDPTSIGMLSTAETHVELARKQFLRYLRKKEKSKEYTFKTSFFRDVMRQYNCDWIIAGEKWGPPTAANAVDQFQLDFIMGTVNEKYEAHIRERYKYFTSEDQDALDRDIQGKSLLSLIRDNLQLTDTQLESIEPEKLAAILSSQSKQKVQFIDHYVKLVQKTGTLSAMHWNLIRNYLIKPNEEEEIKKKGAVDNTKGGSGMEFPELQEIREMRRSFPQVNSLLMGIEFLTGNSDKALSLHP